MQSAIGPTAGWEAVVDLGWQDGKRVRRSIAAHPCRGDGPAQGLPTAGRQWATAEDGRLTVATWLGRWLELQQGGSKAVNAIALY